MSTMRHCLLTLACAGACGGFASAVRAEDPMPAIWRKWGPWAEVGGYAGNHAEARRGETTLWAPLVQGSYSLLFADIRATLYDGEQQAGNLALGYRQMLTNEWNLGIWTGYDQRRTATSKTFGQIAAGAEALSPNWDLRVNGYLPLADAKAISNTITGTGASTLELADDSLYLITAQQTRTDVTDLAFRGVDAEIGMRVPVDWAPDSNADLRIFLGGYYFENNSFAEPIIGPRLRTELRFNDILRDWTGSRLTVEAVYSYDDVHDGEIRLGALLRIPLGGGAAQRGQTPQDERMMEGLQRRTDIVTHKQTLTTITVPAVREQVEDTETGVDLLHTVIVSNGANLQGAINAAGQNSLIVAQGGEAKFDIVALADNQTLLGGGGSLLVRGLTTGKLATFTAPGTQPTLYIHGQEIFTGTISGPGIATANNSHISDFILEGNLELYGQPPDRAVVTFVLVGSGQTVVLDHLTMGVGQWGVYVLGTDSNVTFRDSSSALTASDIYLDGSRNTIVADNNLFGSNYMVIRSNGSNNLTLSNNIFSGYQGQYDRGYIWGTVFAFANGDTTILPGSTGNIDLTTVRSGGYCQLNNATLSGSIEFTNMSPITQASCTSSE